MLVWIGCISKVPERPVAKYTLELHFLLALANGNRRKSSTWLKEYLLWEVEQSIPCLPISQIEFIYRHFRIGFREENHSNYNAPPIYSFKNNLRERSRLLDHDFCNVRKIFVEDFRNFLRRKFKSPIEAPFSVSARILMCANYTKHKRHNSGSYIRRFLLL